MGFVCIMPPRAPLSPNDTLCNEASEPYLPPPTMSSSCPAFRQKSHPLGSFFCPRPSPYALLLNPGHQWHLEHIVTLFSLYACLPYWHGMHRGIRHYFSLNLNSSMIGFSKYLLFSGHTFLFSEDILPSK